MASQPASLRRPESNIPFYGNNTANEAFRASQYFSENEAARSLTSSQDLRNEEPSRSARSSGYITTWTSWSVLSLGLLGPVLGP